MVSKEQLIDPDEIDYNNIVADIEEIRRYNPQRHEMEQLTAIVLEDFERELVVGYKDVTRDEFWSRGHMPGMPLMPGVVMCEAAAQLSSYYVQKYDLLKAQMVGFGGMENIRFRDLVIPGDRLVIACKMTKVRPRRISVCRFEGYVRGSVVVEGIIKGISLPVDAVNVMLGQAE